MQQYFAREKSNGKWVCKNFSTEIYMKDSDILCIQYKYNTKQSNTIQHSTLRKQLNAI